LQPGKYILKNCPVLPLAGHKNLPGAFLPKLFNIMPASANLQAFLGIFQCRHGLKAVSWVDKKPIGRAFWQMSQ
jgi:hypothetical protein